MKKGSTGEVVEAMGWLRGIGKEGRDSSDVGKGMGKANEHVFNQHRLIRIHPSALFSFPTRHSSLHAVHTTGSSICNIRGSC